MKIAIIIPTLNERGSLPLLFAELQIVTPKIQSQSYNLEFVIVDDNSQDGTREYIEECIKNNILPLKLIKRQECNKPKTSQKQACQEYRVYNFPYIFAHRFWYLHYSIYRIKILVTTKNDYTAI